MLQDELRTRTTPVQGAFSSTSSHQLPTSPAVIDAQTVTTVTSKSFSSNKRLAIIYAALFFTPIFAATTLNAVSAKTSLSSAPISPIETPATGALASTSYGKSNSVTADLANANSTSTLNIEYELSLAQGFLKKAVALSNSATTQTVQDKQQIIEYLNEALDASNRAVSLAPEDARAYSTRGRIYQATAAIKPEMKSLADKDFAKAKDLGSSNPTASATTKNPVELLPTEQAQNTSAAQAMIAAPEEEKQQTTATTATSNTLKGTVELTAGKTEVFVSNTTITDTTQIVVTAKTSDTNVFVKQKQTGKGFTIGTTSAPPSNVEVSWKIVQ
jgi:hypothetical protein